MRVHRLLANKTFYAAAGIIGIGIYANVTSPPEPIKPRPPKQQAARQSGPSDWELKFRAERLVRSRLRDPDSAVFGSAHVSQRGGTPVVCGTVNGKNALGGMTGYQRYLSGGITALEEDTEAGAMDELWSRLC